VGQRTSRIWHSDEASGSASFITQYRTPQGKKRRLAFAKAGTLTPDQARAKARLRADRAGDRVLSAEELARLGAALREREADAPMACAALRLIAITGLRRGEACDLRWREVDLDGSCLRLAESKTGKSMRAVGKAAIRHLRSLPRLHDEFVFPQLRSGPGLFEKAARRPL
jgi:integrase